VAGATLRVERCGRVKPAGGRIAQAQLIVRVMAPDAIKEFFTVRYNPFMKALIDSFDHVTVALSALIDMKKVFKFFVHLF
jgi:hypothetical protein